MCVSAEKTQYGKKKEKKETRTTQTKTSLKVLKLALSLSFSAAILYTRTQDEFFPTPKGRERIALHCITKIKKIDPPARLISSLRMID